MPRTAAPVAVPLTLHPGTDPLRHRVADAVVGALQDGRLRPGDRLPSTRSLATDLGVSRGPVVAAYDELVAAGFIRARAGSGAVVAHGADRAAAAGAAAHVPGCGEAAPQRAAGTLREPRWDLRPGHPDTGLLDATAWRRAWRRAGSVVPGVDSSPTPRHAALRRALTQHLRRSRGIALSADDLLVVPGVAAALHALPAALGLVGGRVALEDPGYVEAWTTFQRAGAEIQAVPVDEDGLDPGLLGRGVGAVYVTPSHQYPLGARMPVTRRVELLTWARDHGAVVIEDDYDGEFRYDVSPLPALRSLPGAADHVLYLGTASKLVAPSLRVAWLAAPAHLRDALRRELELRGLVVNEATGLALAHFIESGSLATHHARATRTYAARRAALVDAVSRHLPQHRLSGVDAGLHVVLRLLPDDDDLALVTALEAEGLLASPLSAYGTTVWQSGLVLGYAALPETQADAAVRTIAAVLGTAPR